jgi:diaminohydroxyphosphoribosylaminopyrimidine deaminase/5-amino-6-(5-phosphoribosylamino)uracil reductase
VHRWRRLFPAIAVTADTLLADNPRLTARDAEGEHAPVRFVLDRRFRSAGRVGLNLFTDAFRGRTIVVGLAARARAADLAWYEAEGVKVWALPGEEVDFLDAWAERCATEGLNGVLIEAGPRFASALLREGAADYLFAYVAPRLGGDPESPSWFEGVDFPLMAGTTTLFGQDALFRGYLG